MKSGRRNEERQEKLLLHSGKIRTFDPSHPMAEALVIDNGKIRWIGKNEDIIGIPADEYRLINLGGRTVIPSFGDAHVHFAFFAQSLSNLNLDGCKSYGEALKRVEAYASKLKKGEWLLGKGWRKDDWPDSRWPHKANLDKIAPDNPAALYSHDEHVLWTNSLGLKIGGVDRNTADPVGGEIDRDSSGNPTGILRENACDYVYRHHKKPSKSKVLRLIDEAQRYCHSKGVTALGNFDGIDNFEMLQEYHNKYGLKLRIRQYIPIRFIDHLVALRLKSGFGDDYLRIAGVKIFADGALGSQTALMLRPYSGSKSNIGVEVTPEKVMADLIKKAASNGLACAVHAIGDRANRQVLNAYEKLPAKHRKLRNRIEHVQIINPADIPRLSKLSIIASVQPIHCISDVRLMEKFLGKRSSHSYSFKSFIDSGAHVAFGSDAPIETLDPLLGSYCATTRTTLDGKVRHRTGQAISTETALRGFSCDIAYALADENLFGTISLGKSADIVIMEEDPIECDPVSLKDIEISATFFEGECVFGEDDVETW